MRTNETSSVWTASLRMKSIYMWESPSGGTLDDAQMSSSRHCLNAKCRPSSAFIITNFLAFGWVSRDELSVLSLYKERINSERQTNNFLT